MENLSSTGDGHGSVSSSSESSDIPSVAVTADQEFEQDIDSLSACKLKELLDQIQSANLKLAYENKLMEDAVKEAEQFKGPITLGDKGGPRHKTSSVHSASADSVCSFPDVSETESSIYPAGRRKSRMRSALVESQPVLHVQYKCYIASKKMKVLLSVLENLENSKDFKIGELKAKLEEIDIETNAVEDAKHEFNQLIRIKGKHHITKKVMAEKVCTYFENSLKKKLILTERMRMQASYSKMLRKKVVLEIEEKQDLSENLHEIDFTKIKIEHKKCSEMLKEYNRKFLQLKARSNLSVQVLTDFRKELDNEITQLTSIEKQIAWQERLQRVIEFEKLTFNQQKIRLETAKQKISSNPKKKFLPGIMEYVHLKAEIREIEKTVQSWRSKVAVAEQAKFLYFSSQRWI